jgi:hypothetical protein
VRVSHGFDCSDFFRRKPSVSSFATSSSAVTEWNWREGSVKRSRKTIMLTCRRRSEPDNYELESSARSRPLHEDNGLPSKVGTTRWDRGYDEREIA